MKVKKAPMPLWQKILYVICFIFLFGMFIFLGTRNYKVKELTDAQLFNKEFKSVGVDNNFQVLDSEETLTFLEKGTGLLFLGFPENVWSAPVAELLNEVSKESNYTIQYFNFLAERNNYHTNYQGIVREIDDYLNTDDYGDVHIYAPSVVAIVKGQVIYFDDSTTFMNTLMDPKGYWNSERKEEKKEELMKVIDTLKESSTYAKK